jgi:hypothetical protein
MLLATGHFGPAPNGTAGAQAHTASTPSTEAGRGVRAHTGPAASTEAGADPAQPTSTQTGDLLKGLGGLPALHDPRAALDLASPASGDQLRGLARAGVWALLAAPGVLALSGLWGWPGQAGRLPSGTWLACTAVGVATALVGMWSVTALLAVTRVRVLAVTGALATLFGVVAVMPAVGSVALAHTSPVGAGRWLGLGGLTLVALGWVALGVAVMTSQILNGLDGMLILAAVGLAAVAGLLSWRFPLVIAAVGMFAAASGLGWTASRLTVARVESVRAVGQEPMG